MQVHIKAVSKLHLCLNNLLEEVVDFRAIVLLVDHIEAGDDVRPGIGCDNGINLRLNMPLAEHLESTDDNLHAEEREPELDLVDAVLEDGQLLFERYRVAIVIKETPHNVAVLHDSHHLHHEVASSPVNDPLVEGLVVVERECQLELGLEACPDGVIFELVRSRQQRHLILQVIVELN